jgi:hypothetical protein
MFKYTAPIIRYTSFIILSLLFIVCASYSAAWFHAYRAPPLFTWYAPPRILDTNLDVSNSFHAGDGIVLNYFVRRNAVNCWATHSTVLKGPVLYQFEPYKSNVAKPELAESVDIELRIMQVLPQHLPPGDYEVYQIVTPSCNGFDQAPYHKNSELVITIVR